MDYELGQFGDHPQTRQICERALKLHHKVTSGPVPYPTLLAIAAMCNCPLQSVPPLPEDAPKPVYDPPVNPPVNRIKGKNGRVHA